MSLFSYSVLALDGGGIRGIIPAMVLKEIEDRVNKIQKEKKAGTSLAIEPIKIAEMFDVIAGTSTGGLLAAGLTQTIPASEDNSTTPPKEKKLKNSADYLLELYTGEKGKKIFKKPYPFKLLNTMHNLTTSLFKSTNIEAILWDEFGKARLSEAYTNLLITSYDTVNKKPFYFNSRLAKANPEKEDFTLCDACRATSAAPTYFPPKELDYKGDDSKTKTLSLVDGGMFANNPAMLGYIEAMKIWKADPAYAEQFMDKADDSTNDKGFAAEANPDDFAPPILLVSIGTGQAKKYYPHQDKGWGLTKAADIIAVLMQGVSDSTDFKMQELLPPYEDSTKRYYRLNISIPDKNAEMSDVSATNIEGLKSLGKKLIKDHEEEIEKICQVLYGMKKTHERRRRKGLKKEALAAKEQAIEKIPNTELVESQKEEVKRTSNLSSESMNSKSGAFKDDFS